MKWIKRFFFTLFILIMLLLMGIGIFLMSFDLNHYRETVTKRLSNALGYPVKIQKIATKISLIPTIDISGVLVLNKTQTAPIAQIPHIEAILELSPLIYGQISVQKIAIPSANLNWKTELKSPTQSTDTKNQNAHMKKLWIETITIDKLKCKIEDDKTYDFELENIKIKDLSKTSFDILISGKRINISANLGSILEITKRKDLPINLSFKRQKDFLILSGRIGDLENLRNMHFQLDASIADLSEFFKTFKLNLQAPKLPFKAKLVLEGNLEKANLTMSSLTIGQTDVVSELTGTLQHLKKNPTVNLDAVLSVQNGKFTQFFKIKPLDSSFKIELTKDKIVFSDIQLMANKSDAKGQISVDWKSMPTYIKGNFVSTYFNIYDLWNPPKKSVKETEKGQKTPSFFGSEKLPIDLLNKVDTDIKLNVANLNLSKEFIDYIKLESNIITQKGELDAPFQINIFDGSIKGKLKMSAPKNTLSFSASIADIQLGKIKLINQSIKDSMAYGNISLQAKGNTVRQWANTLSGKIELELTNGQIINKWFNSLPSTLNLLKGNTSALSFSTQDQKTGLICGALNLNVKNGLVGSHNQIALETDILNFIVNGQVNLKRETIDLSVIPFLNQTKGEINDLLSSTQAVHLKGPWKKIETKVEAGKAVENIMRTILRKNPEGNTPLLEQKALCQRALGHPLTQQQRIDRTNQNSNAKATKNPTQEQSGLKQKLLQSLSQALAGQQ